MLPGVTGFQCQLAQMQRKSFILVGQLFSISIYVFYMRLNTKNCSSSQGKASCKRGKWGKEWIFAATKHIFEFSQPWVPTLFNTASAASHVAAPVQEGLAFVSKVAAPA